MPSKVYINDETAILYGSEVGDDIALTSESVTNDNGRQSATDDGDAAPRAVDFKWRGWVQAQATPTLNAALRWYGKTAGSETATPDHWDNDDGTGDIAVSAEAKLVNCDPLGSSIVDEAAADIEFVGHGEWRCPWRHKAIIMWNAMAATVTTDAAETKFRLTPIPPEIQ